VTSSSVTSKIAAMVATMSTTSARTRATSSAMFGIRQLRLLRTSPMLSPTSSTPLSVASSRPSLSPAATTLRIWQCVPFPACLRSRR
jgi:hypothetical protein